MVIDNKLQDCIMWPFGKKPVEQKESAVGKTIFNAMPKPKWMSRKYKSFADEGYTKNVIAFQAINKKAQAVADIPFVLKNKRGEEVTEHPVLSLLENPNPMQSKTEFLKDLVGFFDISGNGYIERVVVRGETKEMYVLRSDRVAIVPSATGIPSAYIYKNSNAQGDSIRFDCDTMTGACDVRHLKTFNPLDDWYGMSPIEAGAWSIDQHNESNKWTQSLLQNGGAPSSVLEIPKESNVSDEAFNRLKAEIDEQVAGSANAGRPLVMEGGMTWKTIGFSPEQMSVLNTKYASARDISLAIGVPPLLLNIPGDSTYSNYQEARLAFYEESVIPLANYIRDELNSWIIPDGYTLELDYDKIPAIAEKRMKLWDMADNSQDLTINERRELKGFEPIDGGNEVFVSSTAIPIGLAGSNIGIQDGTENMDSNTLKYIAYGKK